MAKPQITGWVGPAPDHAGLFAGLNVSDVQKTTWQNIDDNADCGQFWTAVGDDGIAWLSDGTERIAALPARMFRFFHRGIASRRTYLVNKYLKGLITRPTNAVVINFGANIGEIAITLAGHGALVLAIEPDPNIVPLLRANAIGRSIDVVPVAAWNADGPLQIYLNSDHADTSAFNVSEQSVMVEARRIDTLVNERGIARVLRLSALNLVHG